MFHQVSPDDADRVAHLRLPHSPLPAEFSGARFLGRGVAINVGCEPLAQLRETMRQQLKCVLPLDSQPWRPHVTVQNKVAPSVARQLYEEFGNDFQTRSGRVTGLLIWEYLSGPWSLLQQLPFASLR
jgi:hypothetical protein